MKISALKSDKILHHLKVGIPINLIRGTSGLILLLILASSVSSAERPKIGLVLSGGGARGFAHIGVLKVLDSLNVPVDFIVGTSMGSIAGGLYAIGYTPRELDSLANFIDWPIVFSDKPPRKKLTYNEKWDMDRFQLPLLLTEYRISEPSGLIFGQKISMLLNRLVTNEYMNVDFDSLPVPFRCVAAELVSGSEVVLRRGSLAQAIRASMSVPSIFAPVEWGDSLLVDGGVLNNLPVDVAKEMGADLIIAVNVGTPLKTREELSGALSVLIQSFSLAGSQKERKNIALADILLTPDLQNFSNTDFEREKIKAMIEKGHQIARTHISELQQIAAYRNETEVHATRSRFQEGIIHGVRIQGNESLSFSFIYQILGLRPGQVFTINLLENRVEHLYSLGYFANIDYQIEHYTANQYRIYITVRENTSGLLRLGFRYQDDKKIILGVNIKLKDFLAPGILNDMTVLFSGLQLWEWELSYPRRMFGSRFYPYLYAFYQDIPVNIYFQRELISLYRNVGYGGATGIGFIIKNWGVIKTDYFFDRLDIKSELTPVDDTFWPAWRYPVHLGRIFAEVDLLDDPLTPRHGYKLQIGYEKTLDFIEQNDRYNRIYFDQRFYGTPFRHNTTAVYLFAGFSKNADLYRHYYLGGPTSFIGSEYDEFSGPNLAIYRIDSQFHLNDMLSVLLIYNGGNIWQNYREINLKQQRRTGFGVGLEVNTLLGPFRYILGRSEDRNVHYVTFGFSLASRNDERK